MKQKKVMWFWITQWRGKQNQRQEQRWKSKRAGNGKDVDWFEGEKRWQSDGSEETMGFNVKMSTTTTTIALTTSGRVLWVSFLYLTVAKQDRIWRRRRDRRAGCLRIRTCEAGGKFDSILTGKSLVNGICQAKLLKSLLKILEKMRNCLLHLKSW